MYMKTGKITRRVIRYSNIIDLASFFEELSEEENGSCTFLISFRNRSFASVDSADYFQTPYFKYKDALQIQFEYVSRDHGRKVMLCLEESAAFFSDANNFEVISGDEDWINATVAKINDLLAGIPKHSIIRSVFSIPWIISGYFFFHILCWLGMRLSGFSCGSRPLLPNGQPDTTALFLPMSAYFLLVTICFACVSAIVCLLYPAQEFAFGGTRYPRRIKIRKTVGWLLATIIIPIILSQLF